MSEVPLYLVVKVGNLHGVRRQLPRHPLNPKPGFLRDKVTDFRKLPARKSLGSSVCGTWLSRLAISMVSVDSSRVIRSRRSPHADLLWGLGFRV